MPLPSAIIFINADINAGIQSTLKSQLYLDEIVQDTEFDARVLADPNYPQNIHSHGLRVMVIRQNFRDFTNRNLADVVLFVKQGQASVEKNNFGPPGLTFPISRINVYELLRYNNSPNVVILTAPPPPAVSPTSITYGIGGIVVDEIVDSSGVQLPNPDNEYNNPDFINRK
jgi:hypothetical protein